ncbi:uncharacterized protein [Palaemon carinicauda]|uniref:uncharacterized protein isoform X2 n=1 Tax=Palaemon carinicauda TaxID=392227 RepID=UPI0035B5A6DA
MTLDRCHSRENPDSEYHDNELLGEVVMPMQDIVDFWTSQKSQLNVTFKFTNDRKRNVDPRSTEDYQNTVNTSEKEIKPETHLKMLM